MQQAGPSRQGNPAENPQERLFLLHQQDMLVLEVFSQPRFCSDVPCKAIGHACQNQLHTEDLHAAWGKPATSGVTMLQNPLQSGVHLLLLI